MFLPKQKNFLGLYQELADKIIKATDYLEKLEKNYESLPLVAEELKKLEDEADDIVHNIVSQLLYDHTRVTEEKGDIKFFAHNMDNIIDSIEKAVNRLRLYGLKTMPEPVAEFLPFLKEAGLEIKKAIMCLENLKKKEKELTECCIKINELENKADNINRKWLQKILMGSSLKSEKSAAKIIALKEIIDTLEYAMDQCEDVANALEVFRLKGTA